MWQDFLSSLVGFVPAIDANRFNDKLSSIPSFFNGGSGLGGLKYRASTRALQL
jgi:hypothetical protein